MHALFLGLGPDFGTRPSLIRKRLLTVLSESGKTSSIIDDVSIVKRYASELSHAVPVSSDDEASSKAQKEVNCNGCAPRTFLVFIVCLGYIFLHACLHLLLIVGKE